MLRILIPALDRDEGRYADLRLLMESKIFYAPQFPTTIAYKGKRPHIFGADLIEQHEANATFGDACRQLLQAKHTHDNEDLFFLNDDTVLMPDTIEKILEDLDTLRKLKKKVNH
jgi:hypothetical protein